MALKVPSTEHGQDAAQLQALLLEEWIMPRLDHPNLLKAAPQRGPRNQVFAVSDYVEGRTLHQRMLDNPRPELATMRACAHSTGAGCSTAICARTTC